MPPHNVISFSILKYLIVLIALIIINMILVLLLKTLAAKNNEFRDASQIMETNLDGIESGVMRGLDIGIRGYALTKEPEFLDPFEFALDFSKSVLSKIEQSGAVLDIPDERIDSLKNTVNDYNSYSIEQRKLLDVGQESLFIEKLKENYGDEVWHDYNRIRVLIKNEISQKLSVRDKQFEKFQTMVLTTQIVSLLLTALTLYLIFRKIIDFRKVRNEYIKELSRKNEILEDYKSELEIKVQERTHELTQANEELTVAIHNLTEMQTRLIHSEKQASISNLISGIQHEINNPLNFIQGGLDNLEKYSGKSTHEEREVDLKIIRKGFERINKIIQLFSFFVFEKDTQNGTKTDEIIDSLLFLFKPRISDRIIVDQSLKASYSINIDKKSLNLILQNMISNALDELTKIEKDPTLRISSADTKLNGHPAVSLKIFNSGSKLDPDHMNQVFDPFFTLKDPGKGIGMGLSLALWVATQHEGTIEVQNILNGVEFEVVIPAKV